MDQQLADKLDRNQGKAKYAPVLLDLAKARRAKDKKLRRKASRKDRLDGVGIQPVINVSASSARDVVSKAVPLDMNALYIAARRDMGTRIKLTDMYRAGDTEAGKRRRKLNDWELATDEASAGEAWQEDSKHKPKTGERRAAGKCDVKAVAKRNELKRNGANFS